MLDLQAKWIDPESSSGWRKKKTPEGVFFSIWEQVDATRTGVNEIVNKRVIDFLVLLIASDNNL